MYILKLYCIACFVLVSSKKRMTSLRTCRVNANVATDVKEETPMEIALKREDTDMVVLLSKAIGQEIPDDAKIRQLSSLMYQEDQEKAKKEFGELLKTLPSKLVSSE